jgi:hypothetical protein
MARDHLAATGTGPPASAALESYLTELAARLHGPRRARAAVLAEIRDGLAEATAHNTAPGVSTAIAAATAVDQFGTPDAVANAFAGELATAYARHTIAAFILSGPLLGVWWLLLLGPRPWRFDLLTVAAAIPPLPMIAVAIATALVTFASTGQLIRWVPETIPTRAVTAVSTVAGCCLAGDLTMLSVLATRVTTAPGPLSPALAATAATASLVRIAAAARAVRHSRQISQALHESPPSTPTPTDTESWWKVARSRRL